jgi:ATP-dependent helicase/nuclease subunit A
MNPTPQQEAAVTTEGRALLVEAGAGTGKTAVLVQRFVHLLARHPDWPLESIVAVTFTEKATREMRSRIRREIEARAASEGPTSSWQARRRELDRLAVSTIHGLCARILRENPIAAEIDPRFTVLEETDTALLREEAVRRSLAELGARSQDAADPKRNPLELLRWFEVSDLREQMLRLLGQRGTAERLFDKLADADALLLLWREKVREMQAAIWAEHLSRFPDTPAALDGLGRLRVTHPEDKLVEYIRVAQEGCACATLGDHCGAAAKFALIKLNVGRADNFGGKERLTEIKAWLRAARELSECLTKKGYHESVGARDEAAAAALQCWRALWKEVTSVYDDMKAERRALDFDDLERLTWRLLDAAPRDARCQTMIDGINHLMVDEFQDVNELQGEIIGKLADMSAGGKFFAVGDAKQSIYRFRQAQVKVFNEAARKVLAQTGHGPLPLNRSFRTHAGLLAALNSAFDAILEPDGIGYADFEARPGPLEAERPELEPCEVAPASVEIISLPPGLADENRRLEAARLARRLRELVARGFRVWDKQKREMRPVRFDDMAILFRATTSLPLYEEVFKAEGLPYLTVSGRGFFERPEVRDLTALLACLHNPADDLSLAVVLRSPLFSLSDDTLYRLRWSTGEGARAEQPLGFAQALQDALLNPPACAQAEEIAFAAETFAALRRAAGRIDVWQLLRLALDRTGCEATLARADEAEAGSAAGGGRGRANVAKFLQLARDRGGANLSAFLQTAQDLRSREAREGEALPDQPEAGAVQLMSVHAAKGLEFPVVALADLGRAPRGGKAQRILHDPMYGLACQVRDAEGGWATPASYRWAEWLDGRMEQAESKRLLYVACTRAADLLILSGAAKEDTWLNTLSNAWDIEGQVDRNKDGLDTGEELARFPGYSIRITRAAPLSEEDAPSRPLTRREDPVTSPEALPALARPVPPRQAIWPLAVTHVPSTRETEEEEIRRPRPVVLGEGTTAAGGRPWRFLIGNLAHRALAEWNCLTLPDEALRTVLERWARRGGLSAPDDVRSAVEQVAKRLRTLRAAPLYNEICGARERHAEVPLTIRAGERVLHGVLDLLYPDARGQWHLLDWKTERLGRDQSPEEAAAGETMRQMAVYTRAVTEILGFSAVAEICFLSAGAQVYRPEPRLLALAWDELAGEDRAQEGESR